MFEHVLIRITPSGGFIVGKAKERACPARRTNLVFLFGRGSVELEGKIRGTGAGGDEIAAAAALFLSNNSTKGSLRAEPREAW
jgi:hypothetical protein